MELTLSRTHKHLDLIEGRLSTINGKLCDTLENWHFCLAPGTYKVQLLKCHYRSRKMPCIIISPDYRPPCDLCKKPDYVGFNTSSPCICPQICPGNSIHNRLDGAIIVGTNIAQGCLSQPKQAFTKVYDILRKSAERGHDITLIIKNSFDS